VGFDDLILPGINERDVIVLYKKVSEFTPLKHPGVG